MRMHKRWLVALLVAVGVTGSVFAQGGPFTAQIEAFWRLIANGGRTFNTLRAINGIFTGNVTFGGTTTGSGAQTITVSGLGTTSTNGFLLQNLTAATSGTTVQISPNLKWCGTAYNSSAGTSETDCWYAEVLPATAAGTTSALLKLSSTINSGAATNQISFGSGAIYGGGSLTLGIDGAVGTWVFGADGSLLGATGTYPLGWLSSTRMTAPTNGQFNITNSTATSGIGFDVTTDGTLAVRNRAQNAYGTVNALSYQVSGTTAIATTAPSVASGFGSSSAGTVTYNTGTLAVVVTVGTNAGGTTGTLTFPSAPHGWAVSLSDVTTTTDLTRQTGYTQTTAAFSTTVAWTTGDVLVGIAVPF
jgi:hypothetical protein